jgi:predicted PurR-regulated permease PerM/CheY-like chemotaxis protein
MMNPIRTAGSAVHSSNARPTLMIAGSLILVVAALYWAQAVLIPVALSLLLTFLLSPVVNGVERIGIGRIPAVIVVVLFTFLLLAAVGWIITSQVTTLAGELPKYESNIKRKIAVVRNMTKGGKLEQAQKTVEEIKEEIQKTDEPKKAQQVPREVVVQADRSSAFLPLPIVIGPLFERLASAGLVIVLLIFMLTRREDLRNRLIRCIGYGQMTITTKALEEAGERISRYLLMQAIINSIYGTAVGLGLFLIDLPYAILWGLLAAVLRFIPYVGPWIAALMPSALSLAVFDGWVWPLVVIGLFIVLELFTNMILEPWLYGESAGVSEVALLISVAFWTWLWGPIGLLMATPLTVCLVVLGKYVPQMEFITVLMSDAPVAETHILYYQRLLAADPDEAEKIVVEYVKTNPREQVYDQVLVPALKFARMDRDRGSLTDAEEQFVFTATRQIVEKLGGEPPDHRNGAATSNDDNRRLTPTLNILGCPAHDEADESALLMFQQLLETTRYRVEIVADEKLTSEVLTEAREKRTGLVCIAAVQPGGLAQARYLCKRLRSQLPDVKIAVGLWGFEGDLEEKRNSLLSAGADEVSAKLVETRDHITSLGQRIADFNGAPDDLTARPLAT